MGNHDVGRAFAAVADAFWISNAGKPEKDLVMKTLEAVGNRYRGADAEFDDELGDQSTPLGRMVAIAFDAQPDELVYVEGVGRTEQEIESIERSFDRWFMGPGMRFRKHFDFC